MIDVKQLAVEAAENVAASLRDDPTAISAEAITWAALTELCHASAAENARSAVSRALGKIAESLGTEISTDIDENGALADPEALLNAKVSGLNGVDFGPVVDAPDWQGRIDTLRQQLALAVDQMPVAPVPSAVIVRLIRDDPRLAHLRLAPAEDGSLVANLEAEAEAVTWDDEPEDAAETPSADFWNDEPTVAAPAHPEPTNPGATRQPRGAPQAGDPPFPHQLFTDAGLNDTEAAEMLDVSKGYYSQLKNGVRRWTGFTGAQVAGVRENVEDRILALVKLQAAIEALVQE